MITVVQANTARVYPPPPEPWTKRLAAQGDPLTGIAVSGPQRRWLRDVQAELAEATGRRVTTAEVVRRCLQEAMAAYELDGLACLLFAEDVLHDHD